MPNWKKVIVSGSEAHLTSVTSSNGVNLADDAFLNLGDGNDLQLYHDGDNSFIKDAGTGGLFYRGGTQTFQNAAGSKTMVVLNAANSVDLNFNDSTKFQTTNTGVSVTGEVTATGNVSSSLASTGSFGRGFIADSLNLTNNAELRLGPEPHHHALNYNNNGNLDITPRSGFDVDIIRGNLILTTGGIDIKDDMLIVSGTAGGRTTINNDVVTSGNISGSATSTGSFGDGRFASRLSVGTQESPSLYDSGASTMLVSNAGGNAGITIRSSTSGGGTLHFADGTSGNASYRGVIKYGHSDDDFTFFTAGSSRMKLDSSGFLKDMAGVSGSSASTGSFGDGRFHSKVGIGLGIATALSTPHSYLDVRGNNVTPSNGNGSYHTMQLIDTSTSDEGVGGGIAFGGKFVGNSDTIFGEIRGLKENATSNNYAGALTFQTRAHGSNLIEQVRIDSSGNLEAVRGNISGSSTSTGSFGRVETDGDAEFGNNVTINGTNATIANATNPHLFLNDTNAGAAIFQQSGNDTRIGSDSNTQVLLVQNNATAVTIDTNKDAFFVGNISGSVIRASGDIIAFNSSDERLKDNVTYIHKPIEKINQIGGYEFDWNEKQQVYHGHDVGVLAQELEKVLPEAVKDRDSGYKGVQYDKIIPLLIEGIKEQTDHIKDLKERIEKLEKLNKLF